jgi:predicted O-methyltransferase YrrM
MAIIDRVAAAMQDQPWGVTEEQGRLLYSFILREEPEQILELGCGIGTSACYMAAALAELGRGRVTSIDRNPDLPEWVARTFAKVSPEFQRHHELVISATSYNDHLLKIIETQTNDGVCQPFVDFCFIDGAHTWEIDGCAFFLSEKLLKPGKWMLFDDLNWTIANSPEVQKNMTGSVPMELQQMAQVRKVFNFLVAQHPSFECFLVADEWGWARKKFDGGSLSNVANPIVELYRKPRFLKRQFQRIRQGFRFMYHSIGMGTVDPPHHRGDYEPGHHRRWLQHTSGSHPTDRLAQVSINCG